MKGDEPMITPDADSFIELALPYFDDISNENELDEYIEDDTAIDWPADWTKEDILTQVIGNDVHDLLKNGNDEDLNWSEADVDELRDGNYYEDLDAIARLIAKKVLSRIYPS
jgi:hypothetical protein